MSFMRLDVSLAFKEPLSDKDKKLFDDAVKAIGKIRSKAKKIRDDEPLKASYHSCHDDEPNNKISCKDAIVEI